MIYHYMSCFEGVSLYWVSSLEGFHCICITTIKILNVAGNEKFCMVQYDKLFYDINNLKNLIQLNICFNTQIKLVAYDIFVIAW